MSPTSLILKWQINNKTNDKKLIYDIYLGETKTPRLYVSNLPTNIYLVKILKPATIYYWKIVAKDGNNTYESPIWSFKTRNFNNGEQIWISLIEKSEKLLYFNNTLFNLYTNVIEAYNDDKKLIYTINDEYLDISIDNKYIYLLSKNKIKLYSIKEGLYEKSIEISQNYEKIKTINNYILLYSKNLLDIYKNFEKVINLNFDEKIKNIYPFKNAIVINTTNKILIINYSGKILKDFKLSADILDLNEYNMLLRISNILYLFSYNNQRIKISENFRNAFLHNGKIYIIKNTEVIIQDIKILDKKTVLNIDNPNHILLTKNGLIVFGNDILYSTDLNGNIIWKKFFKNMKIMDIVVTNHNSFVFTIIDETGNKIVEIFDSDIQQMEKKDNKFISFKIIKDNFNIDNNIPTTLPTPVIINPQFNEKIRDFTVSLKWTLPEYESTTVTFEIQLKEISSGLLKNKKISNIKHNELVISLEPNTKYIWRVTAKDKKQIKTSDWSSFSTDSLNFVIKRIKLPENQMISRFKLKDNIIYFTGYTINSNKVLELLYGTIMTNFSNLRAWNFGNSHDKYATAIDLTNDNNIIIGGFSSEKDLRGDMLLYSISPEGNINWDVVTGSSKRDSINDLYFDNGYIYTLGTVGTDNMVTNIQFSKFNKKGFRIWTRDFGGDEFEFGGKLKRIDKYSFLLLSSTNSFGDGGYDYYIIKTNELGKKIWDLTSGTPKNDMASDLILVSKNEYIIIGTSFQDTLQPFITKIDGNGFKIYEKKIPFTNDVNLITSKINGSYFYSIGWYREKNTLKRKGIILKFDLSGNLKWAKTFQINSQDTIFTDLTIKDDKIFISGVSEYPQPNKRDIFLIQTTENYIINNFKSAK
ncbi:hypothetical protein XO12_10535 [Marinitoga sp. 1154]|uniref:fibronectin type III domain-containing protein n=1 Tax=Marinitoga sp. 1154 TaxID=1643335 RepID=UPI001585DE26|nr:fibronectin type III domain-containing protein [Marinitoga sp. 1154]NUV00504.1 hypothetical protein [Marinitoga sp. 1154]